MWVGASLNSPTKIMKFTSSLVAYDAETGKFVRTDLLQLVNALLRAKSGTDPWKVVELCVKAFKEMYPTRYSSYVIRLKELREAEKKTWVGNKEFRGVSRAGGTMMAHTVDFPAWIMGLLRKVYRPDELNMDKDFFREFAIRHPEFRVMEKV